MEGGCKGKHKSQVRKGGCGWVKSSADITDTEILSLAEPRMPAAYFLDIPKSKSTKKTKYLHNQTKKNTTKNPNKQANKNHKQKPTTKQQKKSP